MKTMKRIIAISILVFLCLNVHAQNFELSFITLDRFLIENYSLSQITAKLKPNYTIVLKNETQWKYRDENKSWEADLYVLFDKKTKAVKEIAFVAPDTRNIEYYDQLTNDLGFKVTGKDMNGFDVLENSEKKLGAKLFSSDLLGKGMWYFRIYRL